MKKSYNLFLVLFLLLPLSSLIAQNANIDLKMAAEKYEICLKTGHCEIMTSTLIHLMKMYHQYPDQDYSRVIGVLDSLAASIKSKPVCIKVLLTKQYLNGERDLDWMMAFSYEEIYDFLKLWSVSGMKEFAFEKSRSVEN
jgi:hypothetical protein